MPHFLDLRPRVMDPRRRDELTEALMAVALPPKPGEPPPMPIAYVINEYPKGLREVTLGPNSKKWVGVSRYYPSLEPKVVVDFEPAPPDKWWFEEKVQFFTERGILYLGIALTDRLTPEQFADRYKAAKHRLDRSKADQEHVAAVDATVVEDVLLQPEIALGLDRKAAALAALDRDKMDRPLGGAALMHRTRKHRETLVAEYRRRLRHGLDIGECARELAGETERQRDGQVHTSVAS